ncbi:penicillin-binding protein 2 [Parasphingorhabdus sp.]|uniref:penicillin-binding protein 2 n=1 Tax=Parasphingorhabdus sp. TaxID=2709688 RepID=UPI003BAFECC6
MKNTKTITGSVQSLTFSRRATLLGGASLGIGVVLIGRMGYISVVENSRYKLLSESNRVNFTLIPPRRGWLLDRNEKPIANNKVDFRIDLNPSRVKDIHATIATLRKLLRLEPDEVARINAELRRANNFQPIHVASGLDLNGFAAVSVRLPDLPGVSASRGFSRDYPPGAAVGHLVGYVGTPSAEEYEKNPSPILLAPGYKIGKDGLEKRFEETLQGKPGAKRVEVTARGKIVRELETRSDVPGKSMQLTLNAELQRYAARRLGEESGSVVVLDGQTGEILTMTSMPSFDPNSFSDGISQNEWQMLSSDDHVPLRDKSLRGLYPPGSTIKPMVALALLKEGIKEDDTIVCTGRLKVGNSYFHCWKRGGHGRVNMAKAIYQSCDIYFYQMALRVGIMPIAQMAKALGLGAKYDLPVSSQSYGTVPDARWKLRKYNKKWQAYDTVNTTIGQGYMLSNPLQLAVMAARMASGRSIAPSLLLAKNTPPSAILDIPSEHLAFVRRAMGDVVSPIGTARRAALPLPNLKMGGKTGTAQVRRITMEERAGGVRSNASLPWRFRDHGLFIAFAPVDNPRYAVSVVVEHGGGSGSAYPIARDVMTFLYDRKIAMDALLKLEANWGGDIEERMARKLVEFKATQTVKAED